MPRIPIYESQVSTPNPGPSYMMGVAAQAGEGAALKVNALQGLGRGLEYSANLLKEKEDQDETLKALNEFSTFKIDQAKKIRERQEAAEPGAPGFVDTTLKDYEADSNALLGKFQNKKAQQVLRQHLSSYSTSLADQAIGFESNSRVKQRIEVAQDTIDKEAKTVRADPSALGRSTSLWREYVAEAKLPPAEQARILKHGLDVIASQAVRGMIDGDPWKAEKRIRSGELDDALSAQNKDTLLNVAKAEQRHRNAEARQAQALNIAKAQNSAQNYIAQLAVNPNAPPPPDIRYDNLVATLGQKNADNIATHIDQARMVGEDARLLRSMIPADRKQYIDELTAAVGAKPDGAGLALHRARSAVAAVQDIEKEFLDDPAQFGIKHNPTVAANAQNFFDSWGSPDVTPERKRDLWNQYKASQEGYQRNQGLNKPALLSKPLAEKLALSVDQSKSADEVVNNMKALTSILGDDAPGVLAKVSKGTSPGFSFLPDMTNKAGTELVTAIRMHKDVDKALTDDQKKTVKSTAVDLTDEVSTAMKDYVNGPALMENLNDTVSTYAKYLVWKDGLSESAAAKKAFDSVWGENFKMYGTFYVPKKDDSPDLDVAARDIVSRIEPSKLRRSSDIMYTAGQTEAENQSQLASALKSKHTLTTTEDRKGVYVRYGNGQIVMLKDGNPWILTWDELRKNKTLNPDTNMGTNIP